MLSFIDVNEHQQCDFQCHSATQVSSEIALVLIEPYKEKNAI